MERRFKKKRNKKRNAMNVKQFMIDVNPQLKNKYLNVNHPNAPIKKRRFSKWIKNKNKLYVV